MLKINEGFNVASFHLVIRNDNHCPTCRRWYLNVKRDDEKLQNDLVEWEDEWVRRRNGDKYQKINIIPNFKYDLSEWSLDSNKHLNVNVTHFLLIIKINKYKWCPKNIKFYISFYDKKIDAYNAASKFLNKSELTNIENGHWQKDDEPNHKGRLKL